MKKLITVRHAESVGNQKGIIQGNDNDYGLTEKGKEQLLNQLKIKQDLFQNANQIITSPSKRTMQTAQMVNLFLQKPITADSLLREFDSGILSGKSHEEVKEKLPELYQIWKQRGDLDKIPKAERGEKLQARAIAFLSQYVEKEEFCDVIVSHAGFLRCFINTIKGIDRTTPVDLSNGAIHVLEDPFKHVKFTFKDRAMTSDVYIVETFEQKYVVKKKKEKGTPEDQKEKVLIEQLRGKIEQLPEILYMGDYPQEGSIKVLHYIEGEHAYGRLPFPEREAMIEELINLRQALQGIDAQDFKKQDLYLQLVQKTEAATHPYIKEMGKRLLENRVYANRLKNAEYGLVHNDLNRDNILFRSQDGKMKASIIDFESIKRLPKDYQLAVFLTCGLLLEGESMEVVLNTLKKIEPKADEKYILYLMEIRLFNGIQFFIQNRGLTGEKREIGNDILHKYCIANERLQTYKTKEYSFWGKKGGYDQMELNKKEGLEYLEEFQVPTVEQIDIEDLISGKIPIKEGLSIRISPRYGKTSRNEWLDSIHNCTDLEEIKEFYRKYRHNYHVFAHRTLHPEIYGTASKDSNAIRIETYRNIPERKEGKVLNRMVVPLAGNRPMIGELTLANPNKEDYKRFCEVLGYVRKLPFEECVVEYVIEKEQLLFADLTAKEQKSNIRERE